ncbi:MAG TPA: hypothetical protein VFO06_05420 [Gemmatimonadales bacterium]|nr:hypothetical protein [Gemmatimonadales bacterium]
MLLLAVVATQLEAGLRAPACDSHTVAAHHAGHDGPDGSHQHRGEAPRCVCPALCATSILPSLPLRLLQAPAALPVAHTLPVPTAGTSRPLPSQLLPPSVGPPLLG